MTRLIYLHGFASGPSSKKAVMFRQRFAAEGAELEVPDLNGGDFERITVTRQLEVLERLAGGARVSLIGSSLGGYVAALYAARHPETERVVLLAPAFGFATRLPSFLTLEQYEEWQSTGWRPFFDYREGRERRVHFGLIEDAAKYEEYPEVRRPVLIVHGEHDSDVPLSASREFVGRHPNARLIVVPDGHELLNSFGRIWDETWSFLSGRTAVPE